MSIRGDVGYEAVAGIIESDCCQTGLERNQEDQGHNRPLSCARLYRDDPDELRKKEMMRLKKELPKKEYDKLKGAMWALRKKERGKADR